MKGWNDTMGSRPNRRARAAALAGALTLLLGAGARTAHAEDLAQLLTTLYIDPCTAADQSLCPGILLETSTLNGAPHAGHFQADSLDQLNALTHDLSSSLGSFSFNSTVSSYTFDLELGVPVRTTDSLGPILSERAATLGKNKLNLGFSFNRIEFKRFEGDDLDDLTIFFDHEDVNSDGILGPTAAFPSDVERDRIQVDLDLQLDQSVFTVYGTYGFLSNFDVGVAIPILDVDLKATAQARVNRRAVGVAIAAGANCFPPPGDGAPACGTSADVHNFADPPDPAAAEDSTHSSVNGSSSGIGDVLLRGKYHFLRGDEWRPNLGVVGQVKFPTGDEDNLLGTGDWRGMAMLVADKTFGRVNPHINLGYEIVGGDSDLNNLQYFVGFDARVHPRFTAVVDLLGRWEPSGDGIGDNLVDSAIGGKLNVYRSLVLVSNFIVPLNRNQGLRPDFVWALGIEYTFGAPE